MRVWLTWLERRAHGEVDAISTPIGLIPFYEDLHSLFTTLIGKEYPRELYDRQFSFYLDNIIGRIDVQRQAYAKEKNLPERLFEIYDQQRAELLVLRAKFGPVATPDQLAQAAAERMPDR